MACVSPIKVKFSDVLQNGRTVENLVPCGKCALCLKRKQDEWALRTVWHHREFPNAVFATLTYNNANLPLVEVGTASSGSCSASLFRRLYPFFGTFVPSLCRSDVRNWLKRCRLNFQRKVNKDVTYFYVGEYGPRTHRPHYHILLFNVSLREFNIYFRQDWERRFGFVRQPRQVSLTGDGSYRYIAKYSCKPESFSNPLSSAGLIEKPRKVASNHYGYEFIAKNSSFYCPPEVTASSGEVVDGVYFTGQELQLYSRQFASYGGLRYALPSYYRHILYGCGQQDVSKLVARRRLSLLCQSKANERRSEFVSVLARSVGSSVAEQVYDERERSSFLEKSRKFNLQLERFYERSQF